MCRYGVSYVKDPATDKYIPTCNRTLYSPIYSDENYKNAIKYADAEQRTLYGTNARIIDDIQKGILAVSTKEKPFDIFISYKETDSNGIRTKDSVMAQNLYEKLTAEGYKVFFSRITLEDKVGTEYEPYIYAALASSKVMITVSSSKENIEAVWVKNEWSRFLSFAANDSSKTLIPLYFDMDKSDLPDAFAHISAYDMKVDGFEQELIRGIKKLIPLPIMLLERRKKRNKILTRSGIVVAACAVVGLICAIPWFAKLPAYNDAMQLYYDKNYPEATWAFSDMGSYRNSEGMKEKCELSWRNSLATVALPAVFDDTGFYSGAYYVGANGTAETFSDDSGSFANDIKIDENGKVVSIGYHEPKLYALRENGAVTNAAENNNMKDDLQWHNIVKISNSFRTTNIALRADGKMLYGNVVNQHSEEFSDYWLEDIAEWNNIVDFDYCEADYGYNCAIVGVMADGSVTAVTTDKFFPYESDLQKFNDVKMIDVSIVSSNKVNPDTGYIYDEKYLNIVAITNHGTIATYMRGVFNEFEADGVISFVNRNYYDETIEDFYFLYEDGTVRKNDGIVILNDVVCLDDNFAITRSGSLYAYKATKYDDTSHEWIFEYVPKNVKTVVYNEWVERLK